MTNQSDEPFTHEIVKPVALNLPVYWIIHDAKEQQHAVPRHWHEELELNLTVSGQLTDFLIDGQVFDTQTGDVLVINSGSVHAIPIQKIGNEALTLFFNNEFLRTALPNISELVFATHPNAISQVESTELVDYLYAMHYTVRHDPTNYLRITRLAYDILDELVMHFSNHDFGVNPHLIQAKDEKLYKILWYIKTNVHHGLTVSAIAAHFEVSTSYLSRYFKMKLQMTPLEYLQAIRLNKAYQYLMNTNKSISWISDMTGFGDVKSFERLFKTTYGLSPKKYRQQFTN
ncbi:AraC family transcriptional regulator [Leuconostoc holzapfelii]|uniref:AraC family transcriptional regulator n=1 Tax=Leuconostoc holzapfelii TaxID=434464 RepID=A0ABT2NUA2_9LACO|nr:AraC family transcriptional regulator [Leuconostoc holzapfelii]MCT8388940.1 AraC family transcriptional regulator [Leuconostoc holzapfelii]